MNPRIVYEQIEYHTARELLDLDRDELEALIARARKERSKAERILEWLSAIRLEKRIREEAEKGGRT